MASLNLIRADPHHATRRQSGGMWVLGVQPSPSFSAFAFPAVWALAVLSLGAFGPVAQAERARLLVKVAPLQIESAGGRRHLAAVVRQRLLDDGPLGLFRQHAKRHPRTEQASGFREAARGKAVPDVVFADRVVRRQD